MVTRLQKLLVATALVAGSVGVAGAQYGYTDRDWDRGYHRNFYANAKDFGYQDGYNDGRNDRITGHSFRPTHDSNFKHADRGFYGGYGDRNYYKQMYRQAYEDGYDRGYNSARYYDRWQR